MNWVPGFLLGMDRRNRAFLAGLFMEDLSVEGQGSLAVINNADYVVSEPVPASPSRPVLQKS